MHVIADSRPRVAGRGGRGANRRWVQWGAAVAMVVLAAAGFAWLVPVHRADAARLHRLVASRPPKGFTAVAASQKAVPASQTGLSRLAAAAATTPAETGAYAVKWDGDPAHGKKGAVAEVLVAVAPTAPEAAAVRAQARLRFLGAKDMRAAGYSLDQRFAVRDAPGSHGATFTATSTSTSTTTPGTMAELVMGTGRTVAVLYVQGDAGTTRADIAALAVAQQTAFDRAGPDVSPAVARYPLVATVATIAGTVVALLVVALGPAMVGRARDRRIEARRRTVERERLARGRKVVKRQAAAGPVWRPAARQRSAGWLRGRPPRG